MTLSLNLQRRAADAAEAEIQARRGWLMQRRDDAVNESDALAGAEADEIRRIDTDAMASRANIRRLYAQLRESAASRAKEFTAELAALEVTDDLPMTGHNSSHADGETAPKKPRIVAKAEG